jgi:hypothetical protein
VVDWVERVASGKAHPEESLIDFVEQVQAMAADPSPDTAQRIGLRTRFVTNAESLQASWGRFGAG